MGKSEKVNQSMPWIPLATATKSVSAALHPNSAKLAQTMLSATAGSTNDETSRFTQKKTKIRAKHLFSTAISLLPNKCSNRVNSRNPVRASGSTGSMKTNLVPILPPWEEELRVILAQARKDDSSPLNINAVVATEIHLRKSTPQLSNAALEKPPASKATAHKRFCFDVKQTLTRNILLTKNQKYKLSI